MNELTELFREFPGIGPRQARRFAYFLMSKPKGYTDRLIAAIQSVRNTVHTCPTCFRLLTNKECSTCVNRENMLMIVSRDIDLENIEKTGAYNGYYFVLGGTVPILDKNPEQRIRIAELIKRIDQNNISEIIFSMSLTPEGENTEQYVRSVIKKDIKMSTLGRGLSTGSELEYVDGDTLKNALKNRFI
jgi:recombination protein RecR